ncbi:MAG: YciI family protein [Pseudomonadota bacterium]
MPAWDDYKAQAKERGALAHEVFVVQSLKNADGDIPTVLPDHLAYIGSLEAAGSLMFAGPMSDPTGARNDGDGMLILRAGSLKEATQMAANDPMHLTGTRSFTIRKWMINEGTVSLSVGLSAGKVTLG